MQKSCASPAGYRKTPANSRPALRLGFALAVFSLAPLAAAPQASPPSKDEQSCQDFVQQFYDWYLSFNTSKGKLPANGPSEEDVLRLRPQVLSPELLRMLKEDLEASKKSSDDVVGLDFDPFLNTQDPSPKFKLERVTVKDGHCNAVVYGIRGGKKQEKVKPELTQGASGWVFVNFHYDSETPKDDNLIDILKSLREDRKKPQS
jgi:hypothetical protein